MVKFAESELTLEIELQNWTALYGEGTAQIITLCSQQALLMPYLRPVDLSNEVEIKQVRDMWDGPVIVKGVMDAEDALKAINIGADAVVVSNHGGRQLDGAMSSIRALERISDAVGDKAEIHFDSGIRSGLDVQAMGGCWREGRWACVENVLCPPK